MYFNKMNEIIKDTPNEFSFLDLISLAMVVKYRIIIFTFFLTIGSAFYAFNLKDQFESFAILEASSKYNINQPQSAITSSLGSLGILAGAGSANNSTLLAIENIKSKDFFDILLLNESFISDLLDGKRNIYSYEQLHSIYLNNLKISNNKATSTTRIGFSNTSAQKSFKLLSFIIKSLNDYIRDKELKTSESQILFLEERLTKTQNSDVKLIIASLIESNLKKSMISENSDEYVFTYIDSPRIPENKSSPKRTIIILLTFLLSFIASLLFFVCLEIFKNYKKADTSFS
jgi:uncharacterized protein involved in exopolysaccharide biosynthesis